MYSDVVSSIAEAAEPVLNGLATVDGLDLGEVYGPWKDWPVSDISHHDAMCCETAREWLLATDHSELGGESMNTGPRWLKRLFKWGPSEFPIYWCEALKREHLDCGALAALAYEIFRARGVRTLRVQMVQRFSRLSIDQWADHWESESQLNWTAEDLIYHEGCAIVSDAGEIKIWDSSAGWWVEPPASDGYGSLLALRISDRKLQNCPEVYWCNQALRPFIWTRLVGAAG